MTVTFHIAYRDGDELTALTAEGAPSLNVHNAAAGALLHLLDVPFDWFGEIDPQVIFAGIDAAGAPDDPVATSRLDRLRMVAVTATRVGRNVAWD
ncbi:MAG: hypothetical protein QM733_04395 [Ilumatobacteraceae bacterium]